MLGFGRCDRRDLGIVLTVEKRSRYEKLIVNDRVFNEMKHRGGLSDGSGGVNS